MKTETEQFEIISCTLLVIMMLTKASYYPDAFTKDHKIEKQLPEDFAVALSADQLIWCLKTFFNQDCPVEIMEQILSNPYARTTISGRTIGNQKPTYRIFNRDEMRGSDF